MPKIHPQALTAGEDNHKILVSHEGEDLSDVHSARAEYEYHGETHRWDCHTLESHGSDKHAVTVSIRVGDKPVAPKPSGPHLVTNGSGKLTVILTKSQGPQAREIRVEQSGVVVS